MKEANLVANKGNKFKLYLYLKFSTGYTNGLGSFAAKLELQSAPK